MVDILTDAAEKLDDLAESFSTSDEELAELNAGKTQEEIDEEDEIAEQIAAPFVNALDSMTAILNSATEEIMKMTSEEAEEPDMKPAEDASSTITTSTGGNGNTSIKRIKDGND
jgi:phage terminase Nu1 subunit (DNA packaging protein)